MIDCHYSLLQNTLYSNSKSAYASLLIRLLSIPFLSQLDPLYNEIQPSSLGSLNSFVNNFLFNLVVMCVCFG